MGIENEKNIKKKTENNRKILIKNKIKATCLLQMKLFNQVVNRRLMQPPEF
jgi:hypothetical protein